MAQATLSELRIDETTWSTGTSARKGEWRVAIAEVVQEGHFETADVADGERHPVLLTIGFDRARLEVQGGAGQPAGAHDLPIRELKPLMDEYMQICGEMSKLGLGANSPRLEALDIAKRITHDEAGELLRGAMRGLRPDHGTARRLFTLLVTLYHDTTKLAAPAHIRR
jgi:uncharacterized protein (UPF0262 family)